MTAVERLQEDFVERFGREPLIFRAPARVNLIGEHTDYNDGLVMPFAIEKAVYVAASPRKDDRVTVASVGYTESLDVKLSDLSRTAVPTGWTRYPFGVVSLLSRAGHNLGAADLLISSDIPSGAGLSSSAALEVGIASALKDLSDLTLSDVELAKIGQSAEHEFAGVKSGLMDQMASLLGRAGYALFLDCRSLEWEHIRLGDASFLVCDTRTKHSLAESEYNTRRRECEEAAASLGKPSLRDVSLADIESLPSTLAMRARHVITENGRVVSTIEALRSGDLQTVGGLLDESHASLRDDFQVSCKELDIMSEICRSQPEILGSRMMGGGFGGCTISVCRAGVDNGGLAASIASEYRSQTGIQARIFPCSPSDGATKIGLPL